MTHSQQHLSAYSVSMFLARLAVTLLFVTACVVHAQNNSNTPNTNTGVTNINRESNASVSTNTNLGQSNSANVRANGNSNTANAGNAGTDGGRDGLTTSGFYFFFVTLLFLILLAPFVYAITRAILFSKATFSSPLGLPDGSLRAMLAFMLVAFLGIYVYASVLRPPPGLEPPQFLLGIVATVVGFYFGSRSSEDRDKNTAAQRVGTVQGGVTDNTGAAAAGAEVVLSGADGKKVSAKADAKGKYKLDNVPPGDYDIQASLQGHAPSTPTKIKVTAGGSLTADLKLN